MSLHTLVNKYDDIKVDLKECQNVISGTCNVLQLNEPRIFQLNGLFAVVFVCVSVITALIKLSFQVLVLLNKRDLPGSLDEKELIERL